MYKSNLGNLLDENGYSASGLNMYLLGYAMSNGCEFRNRLLDNNGAFLREPLAWELIAVKQLLGRQYSIGELAEGSERFETVA